MIEEDDDGKEKKYYVHGLDKNMDDRKFRSLLKKLEVPYKSAQKIFSKRFGILSFEVVYWFPHSCIAG